MEQTINHLIEVTAEQAKNIDNLASTIGVLSTEVNEKPSKSRALLYSLMVNAATLILVVILALGLHNAQARIDTNTKATNQIVNQISDCLNPSGACAQRGRDNTAKTITVVKCNNEAIIKQLVPDYQVTPDCVDMVNASGG